MQRTLKQTNKITSQPNPNKQTKSKIKTSLTSKFSKARQTHKMKPPLKSNQIKASKENQINSNHSKTKQQIKLTPIISYSTHKFNLTVKSTRLSSNQIKSNRNQNNNNQNPIKTRTIQTRAPSKQITPSRRTVRHLKHTLAGTGCDQCLQGNSIRQCTGPH